MRNAIVLALVLASAPAGAQPVTKSCAVTIARAPDDVRIVVDAWVAAEPSCSTALEVRIIPTEGGLYLLARDEHGRVRERIVPDAQSAGVLIASWAADDAAFIPAPLVARPDVPSPVVPVPVVPLPVVAPADPDPLAAPTMGPAPMPPGMVVAGEAMPPRDGIASTARPSRTSKWISVAGLVGDGEDGGIRGELDILTRGKWSFGAAASASLAHTWVTGWTSSGMMNTSDKKLTATVTRNMQRGRFQLRAAGGLGIVYTQMFAALDPYTFTNSTEYVTGEGVFPVVDASLLVGVELGKNWALTGGPMVTLYSQSFELEPQMTWDPPPPYGLERNNVEVMGYLGLRYRL